MHLVLFLLLPFAAASGWFWGNKNKSSSKKNISSQFSRRYFTGLNYLLNEQPDQAVDIFIKMLEVDSDTVDTYLAIGSLFRRRGEVERAIRIHQNLIARPNLEKTHRIQALLELGRDYMNAGVYDRAERLFLEAEEISGRPNEIAYRNLLLIYQQEHDWIKAINYAEKLQRNTKNDIRPTLANYYCEIVADKRNPVSEDKKIGLLQEALNIDKNCVRASLAEGHFYQQLGDYDAAIKAYQRVAKQDPDFVTEIIEPLIYCYETSGRQGDLIDYLYQRLNDTPQLAIILTITEKLKQWHGDQVAIDFIIEQLHKYPFIKGIQRLLAFYIKEIQGEQQQVLKLAHDFLQSLSSETANYQCNHCGFLTKILEWSCPGCRRWNNIKPIKDKD